MVCDGFIFNREDHTKKDLYIELIDFDEPEKNVFKIVNQFEIEGINNQLRIPDGIVFINGIPVVVFEFKSAVKENTTIMDAYTPVSYTHLDVYKRQPQMPMSDRAAQFSPFAALTGYDAAIKETGRLTDTKIELDDEELHSLNLKFQFLVEHLEDEPEVAVTYFKADERKAGGAYLEATGIVKKLDDFERLITMQDGTKIPMDDILSIDGELFSSLE